MVEHDDESTSFDPRPWGAQQRLLPDARWQRSPAPPSVGRAAMTSRPKPPIARTLSRAPAQQIEFSPVFPVTFESRMHPAGGGYAPTMPPAQVFADAARVSASAIVDYVDVTLQIRRPALTKRSFIAAPLGVLAAVVIALLSFGSSGPSHSSAAVHRMHVDMTVPTLAPPSTVAIVEQPAAVPVAAPVFEPTVPAELRTVAPAPKTKRHRRPHKIVAGDTSTPLGNLRVRRF